LTLPKPPLSLRDATLSDVALFYAIALAPAA
jgi:hypothetical protein